MTTTDPIAPRVVRRYLTALSQDMPTNEAEATINQRLDPAAQRVAREYQRRRHGLEAVGEDEDDAVETNDPELG